MSESNDHTTFPVIPNTDEYTVLTFLVRYSGERFTPPEIVEQTTVTEREISETMEYLLEHQLICHSAETYYVDPDRGPELKRRLKSIDAVVRLFEYTPDDDIYSEEGWEDQVESIL